MKPRYFKLTFDYSNPTGAVCKTYNLAKGVSKFSVSEGSYITQWPPNIDFYYDEGFLEDLLGNALGWLLVSQKIKDLLLNILDPNTIQFLPVNVVDISLGEVTTYWVGNILKTLFAIDWEKTQYQDNLENPQYPIIIKPVLKISQIKDNLIFRLAEQPSIIFVSQDIKYALEKERASGFSFREVDTTN